MSDPQPPNPFEAAQCLSGVYARLRPDDIVNAWPGVTRERVDRLLDRHGGTLAGAMLAAGIDAAVEILRREGSST
ncbi:MAG TPA: hypothetical protein VIL86_16100 [Tepidisphaeraceae bacterium]